MDIQLAPERLFMLEERLTLDEIRQRAMDRRTAAVAGGIGGLLQRPKTDDVVLTQTQRRVEPFWHVKCHARYEYERTRNYLVSASGVEMFRPCSTASLAAKRGPW